MHATSIHQGLRADSVAQPDYDMASASDSVVVPARNSALHAAQTGLLMRTLNVGEGELFLQIWALVLAESVLTALRMRTIARQLCEAIEPDLHKAEKFRWRTTIKRTSQNDNEIVQSLSLHLIVCDGKC